MSEEEEMFSEKDKITLKKGKIEFKIKIRASLALQSRQGRDSRSITKENRPYVLELRAGPNL